MIGAETEDHPFYGPLRDWIAEQVGLPPEAIHTAVVRDIGTQILRHHEGFGDIDGTVELKTGAERICCTVRVEGGEFEMTLDEVRDRIGD